ncbi:Tryptophan halogenase [Hyella patelloides LEGE 07179]|uniref:Tryptophan halogenase n=1 Tax=Hyella patelloides LEGE 07179 TaxID=945734 RepID=A0A563W4Z9_9CYAN|nr:tryptophan 7-halogenase [Hyella patelloides]VEP18771.1 Tryptophan halogenase [Hyella patelloides LEGE 07179]
MKIAVIGGGTAGCMIAAHISKYFPEFELYHIYSSTIPSIGVGEGSFPLFREWIHKITGLSFAALQERCKVTRKFGIQFENWGVKHQQFMHNFYPQNVEHAYHISAIEVVKLLQEHISATYLDKKISSIESDGVEIELKFEDNSQLAVDFAFDARGFPKSFESNDYENIPLIPTNAALVRRGPAVISLSATRSIARPHGWIFVIPLTTHTSYGYIYNSSVNSIAEIETDLNKFLQDEKVETSGNAKRLNFPNFTCKTFFDGSLFKVGNAASFIEPLEATSLALVLLEMVLASDFVLKGLYAAKNKREKFDELTIKAINDFLYEKVWETSLFISWHYAEGSRFKTDFWDFAKSNFDREIKNLEKRGLTDDFQKHLQAGSKLDSWQYLGINDTDCERPLFGFFKSLSFHEMGQGIGYYS